MSLKNISILILSLSLGTGCVYDDKRDEDENDAASKQEEMLLQTTLVQSMASPTSAQTASIKLSNLIVENATLTKVFDPDQTSFTATCPLTTTSVKITPVPEKLTYDVSINGVLGHGGLTYLMPLNTDEETFTIKVTDPATGSNTTYVLIVKRI